MYLFEEVIRLIVPHPSAHARFINTLSLLEYIGARKILKSQHETTITAELLGHIAEEVRHAQVLKRVALKMSQNQLHSFGPEHLLAGAEAKKYFQWVDKGALAGESQPLVSASTASTSAWARYLCTTLLIEERAQKIYPVYEPFLAQAGYPGILRAIVREEDAHLNQTFKHIQEEFGKGANALFEEMRRGEEAAFQRWMEAVVQELGTQQAHPEALTVTMVALE